MPPETAAQHSTGPIFIIGAGPSGLTAAYRLKQAGEHPIVLEKRDRTGGMIHTHREAGYLMEEGATILPSAYQAVVNLAHEIGAGTDLIPAGSIIGFARDDKIHNLRSDHLYLDALKTPLISTRSKLAMARFGVRQYLLKVDDADPLLMGPLHVRLGRRQAGAAEFGDRVQRGQEPDRQHDDDRELPPLEPRHRRATSAGYLRRSTMAQLKRRSDRGAAQSRSTACSWSDDPELKYSSRDSSWPCRE